MKVSHSWLKSYLNVDYSPERISELLTDTGLEVEGLEEVESVKGGLRGVVVGEVLTCVQHPNADRLSLTTVHVGGDEPLQIVCGAPNVAAGQKVPVATIGTLLYPGGEELKIKKGKIRGELSQGMICAEDELGLGQSHDGIMVLDAALEAGTPFAEVVGLQSDYVFEIGLTPNRTDAMGHIGVARDLRAALLQHEGSAPALEMPSATHYAPQVENPFTLKIKDTDGCPSYYGIHFSNVNVTESPEWLVQKLAAIGLTPKNVVVDITNYVLHTWGHPLHAFDAGKLNGNTVVVRSAKEGETLITLDEAERKLTTKDLVIADSSTAHCIAGTLGGIDSGVSKETTEVFLEGAYFNAVRVRKTAKHHGIHSDASYRYERGVDPNATAAAIQHAASLIVELTGATASKMIHSGTTSFAPLQLDVSLDYINATIGTEIPASAVERILTSLDFDIAKSGDTWTLQVPTYRVDVTRPIDVVEEVLRIYGFNQVPIPEQMKISVAKDDKRAALVEQSLLQQLTGLGFNEIMNNSLTKKADYQTLQPELVTQLVEMLNPLSQDLSVMRSNLMFGGLSAIAFNQKRQQFNLRFFERGKTYGKGTNGYYEAQFVDLWSTGEQGADHWNTTATPDSFFELKGILEGLLGRFTDNLVFKPVSHSLYGAAAACYVGKTMVATVGMVHPKVLKHFDVKGSVAHAQIAFEQLIALAGSLEPMYTAVPKYPEIRRDLALVLNEDVSYAQVKEVITATERKLLKDLFLFDVYQGKHLESGKKSYAVGLVYQDPQKTLNDKAVEKSVGRIVHQLGERLGAKLR